MDYVTPKELLREAVFAAKRKSTLNISQMLILGALSGVFLGFATSLAFIVTAQGLPPIVGAILFPAGFVMLVLLGFELATGNFAVLPAGLFAGEVSFTKLLRNWGWVYFGNLLGSVLYAFLFYLAATNCGTTASGTVGDLMKIAAQKKTLSYMALGASGWTTAFVKGILCNWMVTIGAMIAMVSRSTIGKVVAMWLPLLTFFAQGFEHSVVNMFIIPAGMMFGAPISLRNWILWNQIPVTIGNIFAGVVFTAAALHAAYRTKDVPVHEMQLPTVVPAESDAAFAEATGITQ
jgi:formate transporter